MPRYSGYRRRAKNYMFRKGMNLGYSALGAAARRVQRWWKGPRRRKSRRRIPLGFPARQRVKLRYTETINLDAGAGAVSAHSFRATSIYDPNATGTGHQPLFFDQYMVAYDHYTVLGAKITVTPVNPTTADVVPLAYGVVLNDDGVIDYTTTDSIIESNQGHTFKLAGPDNIPQTKYSKSIVKTFSARKFFGKKYVAGAGEYKGTVSTNPTENAYFMVWAGSISGTNAGNIYLICTIEYIVQFSEPKHVAQSV